MSALPVQSARVPVTPAYIAYGDPFTDLPSQLGQITFDVILSEEHERGAIVTDHPVEQGINVADHVRPLPDRLTLEGFTSNSPIDSPDSNWLPMTLDLPIPGQDGPLSFLNGGTTGLIQKGLAAMGIGGPPTSATVYVQQFIGSTDYVRQTYELLTYLRDSATLLTVFTPQSEYYDMILERVTLHRDASTGTSGNFTLEFRQVRVVQSSVVAAPLPAIPRSGTSVSQGKKDPKAASAAMQSAILKTALAAVLHLPGPAAGF